jgi:DNA-binding MarR family transcriptional regulator
MESNLDDRLDFGILLALAYSAFVDDLRASLAGAGYDRLNHSFGYVVRELDAGPLTLRDLALRLRMTSQGALKIVDDMVDSGYLERSADERDGRAKLIALTKKGRAALARARAFHRAFEAKLAKRIGARRTATLRDALSEIIRQREQDGPSVSLRPL